ncbi:MAG: hypothetical protein C0485_09745 [Pirellula sp.]|nr:hypothetical protein [Pirellula sp.]
MWSSILRLSIVGILMPAVSAVSHAAVTAVPTRDANFNDFDAMISTTDVIDGLIPLELAGDRGWHPANPAKFDPDDPNGLPAFTDGVGAVSGVTGLLNDFPNPLGTPVKVIQYDLPSATDIQQIAILSGNKNNSDGRIFTTTVIRYSIDGGFNFLDLGYFESAPLGSINNESGNSGTTIDQALLLTISDDAAATLANGVTNLQFDFYAVDNTQGQYRDPFDGENPFTGLDDQLTAAFSSPLIWEIDVLAQSATPSSADFNGDHRIDGADFLIWQRGFGALGTGTQATGDANGDHNVDSLDLAAWKNQFGSPAPIAAVPEPASLALCMAAAVAVVATRRGRNERRRVT